MAGAVGQLMESCAVIFGCRMELSSKRKHDGIICRTVESAVAGGVMEPYAALLQVGGNDQIGGCISCSGILDGLSMLCGDVLALADVEDVVVAQERNLLMSAAPLCVGMSEENWKKPAENTTAE